MPLLLALLLLVVTACAPRALPVATVAGTELERTARVAYHRMEIAFLQTGSYTTNALLDLELPRGVRWTLEDFSDDSYRLRFTDDNRPGETWLVTPSGVSPAPPTGA